MRDARTSVKEYEDHFGARQVGPLGPQDKLQIGGCLLGLVVIAYLVWKALVLLASFFF